MNAEKPLDGKCVVITRALEQSSELKERLEILGARVLLLPAVSFFGPSDTTQLDRVLASLENFDWVFFTSANAVLFFADRCRKVGRDVRAGRSPRYAAVGPATASVAARTARSGIGVTTARTIVEVGARAGQRLNARGST